MTSYTKLRRPMTTAEREGARRVLLGVAASLATPQANKCGCGHDSTQHEWDIIIHRYSGHRPFAEDVFRCSVCDQCGDWRSP